MKPLALIILSSLLILGATRSDPIDMLVHGFDRHGLWKNGMFPKLFLPESATAKEVIERCLQMTSFDKGHIRKYKVLKVRKVRIPPDRRKYGAALLESDFGKKIVLFRYESANTGWWTRVYDAK